jgi:TetR/AcrR family transcriptional regulator, tetracycline repressor protein
MLGVPQIHGGSPPEPPWQYAPRRSGAAKPQLSRGIVVAAALRVLDAEGGYALTMRRVADQIGVSASSLYGYVANKEELVQLMLERIFEEVDVPPTGGNWQETVKEFARAMLAAYRRHRGVAALTLGRVAVTPGLLAAGERILAEVRSAGMPDQVAAFVRDLGGLYAGAIASELDVAPLARPGQESLAQFTAWMTSLPADRFPNTRELADLLAAGSIEDRFEWGLDVLVRGLASYLTEPLDPRAGWPSGR